jgi:competence protein ComGC
MTEFYDRTAYQLFALEIPHVRGAELVSAVRYKLSGLYPGDISVCNIQIRKNGNKKWGYLVFVLDKNTGHTMLPLSPLFVMRVFARKTARVLYIDKRWLDYTCISNGAIQSSTVKIRDESRLVDDVKDFYDSEDELIIYCDKTDRALLTRSCDDGNIRFFDSRAELKKTDAHKISLFSAKSPVIKLMRVLTAAVVLFVLAVVSLSLYRQRQDENERNALLRLEQEQSQKESLERQRETQRLSELKIQYQEIISLKTTTPFDIAAVIAECAGLQTRIQSATFNGSFFQIEGVSDNSLNLLRRFENHRLVSGARLHQVHPADNRDTFTLSGTVRVETVSVDDSSLSLEGQITVLENLIAVETNNSASGGQLSPSAFGEAVKTLFTNWDCTVNSYQFMNEPQKTEIEYSLMGAGTGFFNALYEIKTGHRLWDVRLVQIRNLYPLNILDIVLRIRTEYRRTNTGGQTGTPAETAANPYPVSTISRNYFPPVSRPRPPSEPVIIREPPTAPVPVRAERVSWLEYVGSVSDDSDIRYIYVKNTRTGNILKLEPASVSQPSGGGNMRYTVNPSGGITAYIDDHIYEINRR